MVWKPTVGGKVMPPTVSFQQIPIKLGSVFWGKVSDIVTVTIVMPACYERVKGLWFVYVLEIKIS